MPSPKTLSRRAFVRLALGGTAAALLQGCAPGATRLASPAATGSPAASPAVTRVLLRNENRPGFYVRYFRPFQAVDAGQWRLTVEGLVPQPLSLSLADIQALPTVSQVSRMKCVECWSAPARWEGFHLRSLLELAVPSEEARWLHFYCADGYYESLSLTGLMRDRVLFVHHMNDEILSEAYGAPLRLMVPYLYGYKSPKAIVRLVFAAEELVGYWPTVGPYTQEGTIKRGQDHPLDLGGSRPIPGGSEIVYPDGIESGTQ